MLKEKLLNKIGKCQKKVPEEWSYLEVSEELEASDIEEFLNKERVCKEFEVDKNNANEEEESEVYFWIHNISRQGKRDELTVKACDGDFILINKNGIKVMTELEYENEYVEKEALVTGMAYKHKFNVRWYFGMESTVEQIFGGQIGIQNGTLKGTKIKSGSVLAMIKNTNNSKVIEIDKSWKEEGLREQIECAKTNPDEKGFVEVEVRFEGYKFDWSRLGVESMIACVNRKLRDKNRESGTVQLLSEFEELNRTIVLEFEGDNYLVRKGDLVGFFGATFGVLRSKVQEELEIIENIKGGGEQ